MRESYKVFDELPDLLRTLGETLFALQGADSDGNGEHRKTSVDEKSALAVSGLSIALEELRAAYHELMESREVAELERARYLDLFQFAPDAYLVTNLSGRIYEANVAAAGVFNVAVPFLVEKPLIVYVHREDVALLSATLRRMKVQDRGECTLRLMPRDGTGPTIIHATIEAHTSDRGPLNRALRWIIHDVTKRVEAEAELEARGNQLRELAAELARVEERERRRIAAAIHDNVSQGLAIARMKVSGLRQEKDLAPAHAKTLSEVDEILGGAVRETRDLTFDLSPPVLYELGLVAGLEWLAERFQRVYGLKIKVSGIARDTPPLDEARILLFQAVRELLTNAVKHAKTKRADVTVTCPDGIWRITVLDHGVGMPHEIIEGEKPSNKSRKGAAENTGFGLFNIRTRLELMGGGMTIAAGTKRGTQITLLAPRPGKHDSDPTRSPLRRS